MEANILYHRQELPKTITSMNAYYGAGPVVKALEMGADIVITGYYASEKINGFFKGCHF